MSLLKIICFDLDGTICDLWEGEHKARLILINQLAEESGHHIEHVTNVYDTEWTKIKQDYMVLVSDGLDEQDIREKHIEKVLDIIGLEASAKKYARIHCTETMDGIYIYPDARKVMETLGKKYTLTMITNGASAWQREKIEKLDIEGYFEELIVSGELGHHKPNPRIFEEMSKRVQVDPSEMIYVGNDYRKDIHGAKDAGWCTAWVKRTVEERDETVPDYVIGELSELLGLL